MRAEISRMNERGKNKDTSWLECISRDAIALGARWIGDYGRNAEDHSCQHGSGRHLTTDKPALRVKKTGDIRYTRWNMPSISTRSVWGQKLSLRPDIVSSVMCWH